MRSTKAALARRGGGKRGGYRVITYYAGSDLPVFLLNVYAKGDKDDLSQAQRNELRAVLSTIAAKYRKADNS